MALAFWAWAIPTKQAHTTVRTIHYTALHLWSERPFGGKVIV